MNKKLVRYIVLLGLGFCIFTAATLWAANTQEALQAASEAIQHQKRTYIEKVMALTLEESEAFWRVYADYEFGLAEVRKVRIKLAADFLAAHASLTDAQALDMLQQKLGIDGEELKFKQSYIPKFKKILPGRKVVRFYQAENKFDTAATSELYRNLPVIR